ILFTQRAENPHHLRGAAFGTDNIRLLVVEDYSTNSIPTLNHLMSNDRRGSRRAHRLHVANRAKKHRLTLIHYDQHRTFLLFAVDPYKRSPGSRRHAPIHRADVVSRLVG